MSRLQVAAVSVMVGLNALDGFDVLSISFASPGIAKAWGIDRAALGVVLSMELVGMGLGSILIGRLADRIGRRRTILGCLMVMAIGMALASTTDGLYPLCAWRILTGLGIGGMLASTNAATAEFSNARRRHLCVALMASGYPVGAVIGGSVVSLLLRHSDWRSVFQFGALATAAFLPIVYCLVPESIDWLCHRQPSNALATVNATLARMGHAAVAVLPRVGANDAHVSLSDLFAPRLARTTALVTTGYFLHITSFYFLLKWVPKIVVDMGFAPSTAAGILVWANVGGASGGVVLGLAAQRFGARPLTMLVLVMSTVMLAVFGRVQADLPSLALLCAVTGFFTNGGVVGLYALIAQSFPTELRASGTGFVIGVGRGGSALAPVLAGYLFETGYALQPVAVIMGMGSLVGACALAFLERRPAPATLSPNREHNVS